MLLKNNFAIVDLKEFLPNFRLYSTELIRYFEQILEEIPVDLKEILGYFITGNFSTFFHRGIF